MANGPLQILLTVEPWHALQVEHEALLDLITGQMGADGLVLPVTCGPVEVYLAPAGSRPAALRVPPGVFFQPNADRYRATRLRPQPSPLVRTRNLPAAIAKGARQRRLTLQLRLSAFFAPNLASRHPAAACKNALQMPSSRYLCPANPDVLELARAALADLQEQFEPDALQLTHWSWQAAFQPEGNPLWPRPPGPVESALLAICFCESCRQQTGRLGVDADAAERSVQTRLLRWLRDERIETRPLQALLGEDEILSQYISAQHRILREALAILARGLPNLLLVLDEANVPYPFEENDLADLPCRIVTTIRQSERLPSPQMPQPRTLPPERTGGTILDLTADAFRDGPDLVRALVQLAAAPVDLIVLDGFSTVSQARLPFVRQAIRAAHRHRAQ